MSFHLAVISLALSHLTVAAAEIQAALDARQEPAANIPIETITVNRFGSMCAVPTAPKPSVSTSAISLQPSQTPLPYTTPTYCTDPVCPHLNNAACIDTQGSTWGVICNATLSGLIAFGTSLRERTFETTFTECLAYCDKQGEGCKGVSYSFENCLIYGSVTGTEAQNGGIAARRLETYGGMLQLV